MTQVLTAFIDENNCIGCGKCIRVCPTDAIVGAKHFLHTVMPLLCTSCEECINACPTDCITLKTPHQPMSPEREAQLKMQKQARLVATKSVPLNIHTEVVINDVPSHEPEQRKQQISDAIARVKARKQLLSK